MSAAATDDGDGKLRGPVSWTPVGGFSTGTPYRPASTNSRTQQCRGRTRRPGLDAGDLHGDARTCATRIVDRRAALRGAARRRPGDELPARARGASTPRSSSTTRTVAGSGSLAGLPANAGLQRLYPPDPLGDAARLPVRRRMDPCRPHPSRCRCSRVAMTRPGRRPGQPPPASASGQAERVPARQVKFSKRRAPRKRVRRSRRASRGREEARGVLIAGTSLGQDSERAPPRLAGAEHGPGRTSTTTAGAPLGRPLRESRPLGTAIAVPPGGRPRRAGRTSPTSQPPAWASPGRPPRPWRAPAPGRRRRVAGRPELHDRRGRHRGPCGHPRRTSTRRHRRRRRPPTTAMPQISGARHATTFSRKASSSSGASRRPPSSRARSSSGWPAGAGHSCRRRDEAQLDALPTVTPQALPDPAASRTGSPARTSTPRPPPVKQLQGTVLGDQANVGTAELNLGACSITAPVSGPWACVRSTWATLCPRRHPTGIAIITEPAPIHVGSRSRRTASRTQARIAAGAVLAGLLALYRTRTDPFSTRRCSCRWTTCRHAELAPRGAKARFANARETLCAEPVRRRAHPCSTRSRTPSSCRSPRSPRPDTATSS